MAVEHTATAIGLLEAFGFSNQVTVGGISDNQIAWFYRGFSEERVEATINEAHSNKAGGPFPVKERVHKCQKSSTTIG